MKLFPEPLNPAAIRLTLQRPGLSSDPPQESVPVPRGACGAEEGVSHPHRGFLKSLSGYAEGFGEKYLPPGLG